MNLKRILWRAGLVHDLPSNPEDKPLISASEVEVERHFEGGGIAYDFRDHREVKKPVERAIAPEVHKDPLSSITEDLLREILHACSSHSETPHVLFSEGLQYVHVVGESFRTDTFYGLARKYQENPNGEIDRWFYGFLFPEPTNPYDRNAIMVYLIDEDKLGKKIKAQHVGYIEKVDAARFQPKILAHWSRGKVIPLLLRIHGGTPEKPNFGVAAQAMTSGMRF